jgi:hypothetical protein
MVVISMKIKNVHASWPWMLELQAYPGEDNERQK